MLEIDVKLAASNSSGAGTGIGSMPENRLVEVSGAENICKSTRV